MSMLRDDYMKAREALAAVSHALDAALVAMHQLKFKTRDEAAQTTLMRQRLAHVRRYREDFDLYLSKIEEAASSLERS